MPHIRRAASVCLVAVLTFPAALAAAELSGTVRAPDGAPLPQLVLLLQGPQGAQRVITGPDGRYSASGLAPGAYALALDAPGFVLEPRPAIELGDAPARLDVVLSPAPVREHVVVSATRGEAALSTVGVAATVLDGARIDEREAVLSLPLLEEVPGVAVARTGGAGMQGSAFIRGGESRYARVLVDGVPVNQPGGPFDFGLAVPLELQRIEVVRGSASSLYGSDALAGVIHFVTRRPAPGDPYRAQVEADAGTFGWRRGQAATSGRRGAFDWTVGAQRLVTDNEVPNSRLSRTAAAGSFGLGLGQATSARLTARLEDGGAGTPGPTAFGRPDLDATFDRQDLVLGLALRHATGSALHELHGGLSRTDQLTLNPVDSGSFMPQWEGRTGAFVISDFPDPLGFQNDTRRAALGYRLELQAGSRHLLTVGAEAERETGALGARAEELLRPRRTNTGVYVQDRVLVGERLHVTAGARLERNGSFGTRLVPRLAAAWRLRGGQGATLLRASAGAGIKEPELFQSFGVSPFARGNPELEPERSRTYDAGLEQRWLQGRLRAEATVFHHDYLDQITFTVLDFETFAGTFVNVGRTRARGLELAVEAAPARAFSLHAQYTLTDAEVRVSASEFDPLFAVGAPLLRRPRHQGSLTARLDAGRAAVAATVVAVGARADSDFVGLGLTENDGHVRCDARARLRLAAGVEALLVVENAFDATYHDVLGYPALGRAVRAGLRWRLGAR